MASYTQVTPEEEVAGLMSASERRRLPDSVVDSLPRPPPPAGVQRRKGDEDAGGGA